MDPWGSLARQPKLPGEIKVRDKLSKTAIRQTRGGHTLRRMIATVVL